MSTLLTIPTPGTLVPEPPPRTAKDIREQVNLIQDVMREVMQEGQHYGVIPGTERTDTHGKDISKKTLLKPGAEKLCLTFRLAPSYTVQETSDGQHLSITSTCTLTSIPTGRVWGSGMGSCSTKEKKYAYSQAVRTCPACRKAAIIKGKADYGGGWLCFKKKDGCGAKYPDGDPAIESQPAGRVPNEYLADAYNTVLKIANKRSLVAAVLNVTAASDIFTQDIGDPEEGTVEGEIISASTGPAPTTSTGSSGQSPPPVADENEWKAVVSKVETPCSVCHESMPIGTPIRWNPKIKNSAKHQQCPPGVDAIAREVFGDAIESA